MIGKTLAQYRILSTLGKGGSGKVYLAEDTRLHRQVALKILKNDLAQDADLLLSFEREAQALAALSHPGVVTVYSVEEVDGIHFLTMEFIEGKPLRKLLPKGGMRLDRFLEIAIPLTDALAAAHQRGITHRDVKPRNVMIADDGRIKVVDFGMAKLRLGDGAGSAKATATLFRKGEIRGTIPYLSPEQVLGKPCGPPSDVFSLGTTFYMMATGTRPFDGKNAMSIISQIVRVNPHSVGELRPDLPQHLVRIIDRCLAKDVEKRYPSALEVRNELQALRYELEGEETTTMRRSDLDWIEEEAALPDETGTLTFSVRRRPAALVAGVVIAGVALMGYLLTRSEKAPPSSESVLKEVESAPESAEANAAIAGVYYAIEWDWEQAERAFSRALEIDSDSSSIRHRYALLLASMGRTDEALVEMQRVVELDPGAPLARWHLAQWQYLAGHAEAADAELERLIELEPGSGAEMARGLQSFLADDLDVAIEHFEAVGEENAYAVQEWLGYSYARVGRQEEAQRVLAEMALEASEGDSPRLGQAAILGALGEIDTAFALLDQALEDRDESLVNLKASLLLEPLRADPRYAALLERMNLPVG